MGVPRFTCRFWKSAGSTHPHLLVRRGEQCRLRRAPDGLAPRLARIRAAQVELVGGAAPSLEERMRSAAALGALQSAILVVEDNDDELEVRANALAAVHRVLLRD